MPLFDRQLPPGLEPLHDLAADLHWSWYHGGDSLWQALNSEVWAHSLNPVNVLQLTSDTHLETLATDPAFMALLREQSETRRRYLESPAWFQTRYPGSRLGYVAYFSMEFGLCDALPLYAGGLGMLAGDHLKTASDLGVPLVGVGLLYQEGYFRQSLDGDGWQQETYLYNDPGSLPLQPLRSADGSWLHIETSFLCRRARFRVWLARVGRVNLYLLDSNDPLNRPCDRSITSKLYGGGTELRLVQEIALGICGWRLIDTLGLPVDVCHLNEGHAAFATLERIRCLRERLDLGFEEALWATRGGNLFTTHTPVEAGFDRYPLPLLRRYIGEYASHLGIPMETLISLGHANPDDPDEDFNMAYLAMRTCAWSNGVSQLHGAVSRRIFQPLFPRWPEREVPLGHVTNGVHVPTWDSPTADQLWTQVYGRERWRRDPDDILSTELDHISDTQVWQMRCEGRARLIGYARERYARQWRYEYIPDSCAIPGPLPLDPNILTLGFARRFAEYKRPTLLLQDPERLARLLTNHQHPVQLILAGKAHPADTRGKQALQAWQDFMQRYQLQQHLVFIEDYDITLAQHLVQGVDLWINTPRRPWEASGTSGMKVLVNGGLNLSSLDGWWVEAYEPGLGWALGDTEEHEGDGDAEDAEALYRLLEEDVIPCFYQRTAENLPSAWLARVRTSMGRLTPRFSSNRMLAEYLNHYYLPATASFQARTADNSRLAKDLNAWHIRLRQHWNELHLGDLHIHDTNDGRFLETTIHLGGLEPGDLNLQVIADARDQHPAFSETLTLSAPLEGAIHAYRYTLQLPEGHFGCDRAPHELTLRLIPSHPQVQIPSEVSLIVWPD